MCEQITPELPALYVSVTREDPRKDTVLIHQLLLFQLEILGGI